MARARAFSAGSSLSLGRGQETTPSLRLDPTKNSSRGSRHARLVRVITISSERSKLTSVVAEYELLGHRLRISASA